MDIRKKPFHVVVYHGRKRLSRVKDWKRQGKMQM
jgi:hypothetical protein